MLRKSTNTYSFKKRKITTYLAWTCAGKVTVAQASVQCGASTAVALGTMLASKPEQLPAYLKTAFGTLNFLAQFFKLQIFYYTRHYPSI
jgi:hypothetical protein